MGRHNGSWAKFHPQMRDHAKTKAAVAVLVQAGIPPEFAYPIVLAAVPALSAWALSNGETGHTGGLSDARFASVAWPESVESRRWGKPIETGALLRNALHAVPPGMSHGYLEGAGPDEKIHDFLDHYGDVIAHRLRNRCAQPASSPARNAARNPARNRGGYARASDNGSGSDSVRGGEQTPPGFASLPADPETDPDREAAEAVADALEEDLGLVQRVLRELALKGVTRDQAVRIALALDGPIGAWDFKAHALKVARPTTPPAAPDHGARPHPNGKALETSAAIAADADRLKAEFDASGYTDRNAWNADRGNGQLRTGSAAARRRWSLPLKAHDAPDPA